MKIKGKYLGLILSLALLLAVALALQGPDGHNQPNFTVFSTTERGASLLYDTLAYLGYPVEIGFAHVDAHTPLTDIVVMIEPNSAHLTRQQETTLANWVERGGRLIYLRTPPASIRAPYLERRFGDDKVETIHFELFTVGGGAALVGPSAIVLNAALRDNGMPGEFIRLQLNEWGGFDRIVFNHAVHGYAPGQNVFAAMPFGLQLLILQLGLAALVLVIHLGKRFGKPVPLYEEIEREENEYIKTLAVIFKNAGRGEVAAEHYYNHFLHGAALYFGVSYQEARDRILSLWEDHNMPGLAELYEINRSIAQGQLYNTKQGGGRILFLRTMRQINQLHKHVKLRYHNDYR